MATVTGTGGADFIHVSGDGLTPGPGQTNNTQATNGDDTITAGGGDDTVHAGGGFDTVNFTGRLQDYNIFVTADGVSVEDLRVGAPDGRDSLFNVEKIVFSDGFIDYGSPVIRIVTGAGDDRIAISESAFSDRIDIVFNNSPVQGQLVILTSEMGPLGLDLETGGGADTIVVTGDLSKAGLSTEWITYQQGSGQSATLVTAPPLSIESGAGDDVINMGNTRFGGSRYGDPLKTWTTKIDLGGGNDRYVGPELDNVIISDSGGGADVGASGHGAWLDLSQFGVAAGQTGFAVDLTQNQVTPPSSLMEVDIAALQYMYGTAGNDSFIGNNSANVFNFVSGVDTAAFGGQEPGRFDLGGGVSIMIVDLQTGTAFDLGPGPGAVFTSIHFTGMEGWIGSRGADILRGDGVGNLFFGDGGNDEIDGRGGVDIALFGGAFADYTRGSASGGGFTLTDTRSGAQLPPWQVSGGIDTLRSIEILGFSDGLRAADPNAGAAFHVNAADWASGFLPRGVIGSSGNDSLRLELSGEVEASINFNPLGFGFGLGEAPPVEVRASQLDEMDIYAPQVGSLRLDGDLSGFGPLSNPLEVFGGDIDNAMDASGLTGSQRVVLDGGGGADTLSGGGGNDLLKGGAGIDTARYATSSNDYAWWRMQDGSWRVQDLRATSPLGTDELIDMEALLFGERTIKLTGATNAEALGLAFEQVMRIKTPTGADLTFLNGLIASVNGSQKTLTQAYGEIVQRADGSTAVAAMAYQFFAGFAPSKGGFDYLVNPDGPNPNNLNSAYYQLFNPENRYINFAVNLGKLGEGRAAFEADYGSLTLRQATAKAYQEIFGGTAPNEAFLSLLLDADVGGGMTRKDYFAVYGGDGLQGLGTKAAMVGWLLTEAAKADVGTLARSSNAYLADLADGAQFLVDMVGVYAQPDWVHNPPG